MNQVTVEDFSELGFAPGSVRGARAFNVGAGAAAGILTGVVYRQWWLIGEMRCTCLKMERMDYSLYAMVYNDGIGMDTNNNEFFPSPDHSMQHCEHGFYGFYDGSNDYHTPYNFRLQGVIEGYGEVMIGERGFRAEKACILALCNEDPGRLDIDLLFHNYPVPWFDSFEEMIAEFPLGEV